MNNYTIRKAEIKDWPTLINIFDKALRTTDVLTDDDWSALYKNLMSFSYPTYDTYVFETLSELLQFCHSASMSGFSGESNLYTDGKRYYLTFTQKCEKVPCGEFAKKVRSTFAKQYFAERCKVICKTDAIAKMASFA